MCGRVVRCIFCLCSLCLCSLCLSLSVSFSLSKFLHLSLTLRVCDHGDVGVPVNLPNNVSSMFYRSRNRIQVTEACQMSRCRNRKMAELNPSNPSDWNSTSTWNLAQRVRSRNYEGRGTKTTTRTLDELFRPRCHHRNRGRAQLRRILRKRKTANSRGSATGIGSGNQHRISKTMHTPDSRSFKPRQSQL